VETDLADADPPSLTQARRLRFDRYVLDLERGCLLLDGSEIALRPKTFAVLLYLVENAGRLVSKEAIFAAVWPNLAITDDVLVQSVGELRRALGEDGARLIRTIPRRGYRFESAVEPAHASAIDDAMVSAVAAAGAPRKAVPPAATPFAGPHGRLLGVLALVVLVAGAMWIGLSNWGSSPGDRSIAEAGAKPAIAVLPFLNRDDDAARDYFADGLTQDIINALGRFSALTVMSWNAVLPYKGKPGSPREIAHSLAVRYQVEGSVQHTGERVRVNAQLVNSEGRVLWSSRFDEALADVFALQDKITAQIVGALAIRVTQAEQRRVFAKPTESLEAYDYVLRARPALQRPDRANNAEARTLLRRAIQLDPNYAAAYAALSETYHIATAMGWAESPAAYLNRAEEMANKALSLNESEVRAHIVLGRIHIAYQRYEQAKAEIDRAIAINPNDAQGLAGRGNILMWSGQTDAAIDALELAKRIDPELNAIDRNALSLAYYLKGRYDASIEQAEINLRKAEDAHFSQIVLAAGYAQLGRSEEAARVVSMIRRVDPTFDPHAFGSKFLNPADIEHLRAGFRKASLYPTEPPSRPATPE
jgi:TolB-like protein/DNA-binding winged helix-turn-helix (wHTH) protein/cytochrome c-type biogenesis protein CcmH/NrfG